MLGKWIVKEGICIRETNPKKIYLKEANAKRIYIGEIIAISWLGLWQSFPVELYLNALITR